MQAQSVNWQVWQDAQIAGRFAADRRGGILGTEQQFDTLLRLVAYVPARPLAVLDVGCGDGIVLDMVMRAFPLGRAIGVDGSAAMLERARDRFAGHDVILVEADFSDPSWLQSLPDGTYDAIVSAFAIHHSEPERQRALYAELFGLLNPGGVFVNIEHIASLSDHGEDLFEAAYAEAIVRYRQANGDEANYPDVLRELQARPDKAANRLVEVGKQLEWLSGIGFTNVDCYWKHFELAVLAGYKPAM